MVQTPASPAHSMEKSGEQWIRGTIFSVDFEPLDDDGEKIDGALLTIRVPASIRVCAGTVFVQMPRPNVDRSDETGSDADRAQKGTSE